jgi:hypothetical protein
VSKVTFHLKGYNKGEIDIPLSITNEVHESLKSMSILGFLISFNS